MGAIVYGYWENARAMAFDAPGVIDTFEPGQFARAQEGVQKLLDQNTGDGTIVALGFLGTEILSKSIDKLAKKAGLKGFDPTVRFLSSLGVGVGLASWLETTTIMNNTVDIPGDLFGVGLGAAAILAVKIISDYATEDNFSKMIDFSGKIFKSINGGLSKMGRLVENTVDKQDEEDSLESGILAIANRIESEAKLD